MHISDIKWISFEVLNSQSTQFIICDPHSSSVLKIKFGSLSLWTTSLIEAVTVLFMILIWRSNRPFRAIIMKYWVNNKINNFGTILCLHPWLGKEAILEKFVCNDVLTASSFSHNIGFLHHQLINETDDAVLLGLYCWLLHGSTHLRWEFHLLKILIGNFVAVNWCTKMSRVPLVLFSNVKMSESDV